MKVTEVRIFKVKDQDPVKAYASVTFDNEFVIGKVRLVDGSKGLFAAMPSEKGKDGKFHDVAFPLNGTLRKEINDAVVEAYEKAEG